MQPEGTGITAAATDLEVLAVAFFVRVADGEDPGVEAWVRQLEDVSRHAELAALLDAGMRAIAVFPGPRASAFGRAGSSPSSVVLSAVGGRSIGTRKKE